MNIALIDDIEIDSEHMKSLLSHYGLQYQLSFSIDCFFSGEAFLKDFEPYKYSIIFMDIFMEGINGVETAKKIREKDTTCIIIFLTSSDAFMPQAFSCHAFEYIQKPATKERVSRVLSDALQILPQISRHLTFTYNRQTLRILYSDIVFVVANKHNTHLTDRQGNTFSPRSGFSEFIKPLTDDKRFLLINKGILINMDYILNFEDNTCLLAGNIRLPVRVREFTHMVHIWQNYTFSQIHVRLSKRR